MQPYEFKRIYHPKLGKFVYQHKGSGLIVDNIFKPAKKMMGKASQMLLKPLAKNALKSGIDHAGDKLSKKAVENSGDLILKKLRGSTKPRASTKPTTKKTPTKSNKPIQEDYNMILNRLISDNGLKK